MRIEANILCYNESDIIRFVIKHYQKFCEKITIWDNYSTDNSREIALEMGCKVESFGIKNQLHDGEYTQLKNNCWKRSTADYVIMCDMDEILFEPPKVVYGNIFKMAGFNMFSDSMPVDDLFEIKKGIPDGNYAKHIIFAPTIGDINFQPGAHQAKPRRPVWGLEQLMVLHYKHIGGVERVLAKHRHYEARKSKYNRDHQFGIQYGFPESQVREYYNSSLNNSKDVI